MDPYAVDEAHGEHNHDEECAAVRDEWEWQSGDRDEGNRHPDVLEHVEEDLSGEADGHDESEFICGLVCGEEASQKEETEGADEEACADEAPLFPDGGEDVVGMNGGAGDETLLDLGARGFETFP